MTDDLKARQESFVAGLRERHPELRDEKLTPVLLSLADGIQQDIIMLKREVAVDALDQTVGLLAKMLQDSLDNLREHGISQATKDVLVNDPVRALHTILSAGYEDILIAITGFADGLEARGMTTPGKAVENDKTIDEGDDFVLTSKTVAQA